MSTRRRKKTSFSDPLPASICPHAGGSTLVHTCSLSIEREREKGRQFVSIFSINVSMTGVMAVSTPLSGEPGGGGENGLGNNGNNGLLGSTSRDAFQKIVSSHTSTQVV